MGVEGGLVGKKNWLRMREPFQINRMRHRIDNDVENQFFLAAWYQNIFFKSLNSNLWSTKLSFPIYDKSNDYNPKIGSIQQEYVLLTVPLTF